jgi:hypothetical protein
LLMVMAGLDEEELLLLSCLQSTPNQPDVGDQQQTLPETLLVAVSTLVFSLALGCLLVHADIFHDDLLSSFLELSSSCAMQVGQKSMFLLPIVQNHGP